MQQQQNKPQSKPEFGESPTTSQPLAASDSDKFQGVQRSPVVSKFTEVTPSSQKSPAA